MENTFQKVYRIVDQIPIGRVTTYGQIACMLGNPRMSRVVGYALNVSPEGRHLPCHRVVNRFGGLARAFEVAGINEQRFLLEEEGVEFTKEGNVDLKQFFWSGPEVSEESAGSAESSGSSESSELAESSESGELEGLER